MDESGNETVLEDEVLGLRTVVNGEGPGSGRRGKAQYSSSGNGNSLHLVEGFQAEVCAVRRSNG